MKIMKKLIAVILLFALALPVFAGEPVERKWSIRASAGYLPSVPVVVSVFGATFLGIAISANEDSNETLDISIPPYFSIDALYHFNTRWSVGLNTGYAGCVWKIVDKDTRVVNSETHLDFIPVTAVGRYNYLYRPKVKLYGSMEAGALLFAGDDFGVTANFQINPIGVEFGQKFFGMAELGIGLNYVGCRLGMGYRF